MAKLTRQLASRIASAACRSTETSWLTPCSAMVTPNSRFMRQGDRIVGDDDEALLGGGGHFVHQIAETLDIVTVERRIDFVEHADRRRISQEHGKDQRHAG